MSDPEPRGTLQWDEIDKFKFFSVGTGLYSALTLMLHPMTVLKIRQQVLSSSVHSMDHLQHQQTLQSTFRQILDSSGVRGLFRGAGLVVLLAIPARLVYITVLEESRQSLSQSLSHLLRPYSSSQADRAGTRNPSVRMPLVTSLAGGLAGGLAAMASQVLVVPMDVITQKQMVMPQKDYVKRGSLPFIVRSELQAGGWRSLFRGFGLSLFASIPTGSVWWATYSGCQHWMEDRCAINFQMSTNDWYWMTLRGGATQVVSGVSAAGVAATLTQPLDVVRARVQVGVSGSSVARASGSRLSTLQVARDLALSSGTRGFFRGLGPRVFHLSVWGTALSSAYELLRHYARKFPE